MKVLLLQDVYNLGRAGDIKKVANGFGRNFLLPQGLAALATPGSLKQADRIKASADIQRNHLNQELAVVAEQLENVQLLFPARAGETGKLYGSVTTQMIADGLSEKTGVELTKRQIDTQPLRLLGMHTARVRLTIDLIPEISVVVYREGESPENYMVVAEDLAGVALQLEEEQAAAPPAGEEPSEEEPAAEEMADESVDEPTPDSPADEELAPEAAAEDLAEEPVEEPAQEPDSEEENA